MIIATFGSFTWPVMMIAGTADPSSPSSTPPIACQLPRSGAETVLGSIPLRPGVGGGLAVRPRAKSCLAAVSLTQVKVTWPDARSSSRPTISTSWPFSPSSGSSTVRQSPGR